MQDNEEKNIPPKRLNQQGATTMDALRLITTHRHDGSVLGGPVIGTPFFCRDTANGHTYKVDCTNGAFVFTQVI